MKPATWGDIELCLNQCTLEDQEIETLEAFSRVSPPPSNNPAFHFRFQNAQDRIRKRIEEAKAAKDAHERSDKNWYERPLGQITMALLIGILLLIITSLLTHRFPVLK